MVFHGYLLSYIVLSCIYTMEDILGDKQVAIGITLVLGENLNKLECCGSKELLPELQK